MESRLLVPLLVSACAAQLPDHTTRVACDGAPSDCFIAGLAHEFGVEAAADTGSAVSLYERACADGDAIACGYLASNLVRPGIPADAVHLGGRLYRRACDLGLGYACVAHGVKLARGFGTPADLDGALEHLDAACKLGTTDGCVLAEAVRTKDMVALERFNLPFASRAQVSAALSEWPRAAAACETLADGPVVLEAAWVVLHSSSALVEVRVHPPGAAMLSCATEMARALPLPTTCVYCAYRAESAVLLGPRTPDTSLAMSH